MKISRFVSMGGILTVITVLFQSAPIFLPVIGLFLSPLSTLPIAIAAAIHIPLGFAVFCSSVFILAIISVQELIILLFTTGMLGIVIGVLLFRKGIIISILFSSVALSLGIMVLTYVVGIPGFIDVTSGLSIYFTSLIFFLFSFAYASIYNTFLKKLINYLRKIKIIS